MLGEGVLDLEVVDRDECPVGFRVHLFELTQALNGLDRRTPECEQRHDSIEQVHTRQNLRFPLQSPGR